MSVFTCNACNATFQDEESQRSHHKLDWHRYNLKRKVAGLPGVTEVWFEKRREALAAERAEEQRMTYKCSLCGKTYSSKKAHEQHTASRSHILKAASAGPATEGAMSDSQPIVKPAPQRPSPAMPPPNGVHTSFNGTGNGGEGDSGEEESDEDWEEVEDDGVAAMESEETGVEEDDGEGELTPWDPSTCLFCLKALGDVESCILHMHKEHGFFIPDAEFLADAEGLLQYLGFKVTHGRECIHCFRQFRSAAAARAHMHDKAHCKLPADEDGEGDEEIEEFYDFSSSYPTPSTSGSTAVTVSASDVPPVSFSEDGYELILKSRSDEDGIVRTRTIGSRELARYYRQRPSTSETRPGVLAAAIAARYRSMGLATRPAWERRPGGKNADSGVVSQRRSEAQRLVAAYRHNKTWNTHNNDPSGR